MRVRPCPLDPLPDGRSHDTERSPGGIAISEQACRKLCPTQDLRVGLPYHDGIIKTRHNHGHLCILPFLDVKRGICYYPNIKRVTVRSLNVKYLNVKIYLCWEDLMADAIDAIIDQWRRELPDVDIWPMSILG